jgi:hypothetical protein
MKFLTKLFGSSPSTAATYTPQSEQEAWIGIMYACMHIDAHISDKELQEMFDLVDKQTLFKGHHVAEYYQPVLLADRKIGSYNLIDSCAPHVHESNKDILFKLIMQLLLADGKLQPIEKEIAEHLTKALPLDFDIARKIVDDLLITNKH